MLSNSMMQRQTGVSGTGRPFTSARTSSLIRPQQQRCSTVCDAASLQFIKGVTEVSVPEVRLTRSRTGGNGTAMFVFDQPSIFQASGSLGDITGLFMVDDEGELTTTDVKAKFVNGKPQAIEARFQMKSQFEWDRFMRFMDRYAEANELGFEKGDGKR